MATASMVTTTTELPDAIGKYYVRKVLYEQKFRLVWYLFADKVPYVEGNGDQVKMRRYLRLDSTPMRLDEGNTGPGKKLGKADLLVTVEWFGDYVLYSDKVKFENRDPILTIAAELLGRQSGEMLDVVLRDVAVAGTNVLYAADDAGTLGAARTDVAGRVSAPLLDKAIRALRVNRAMEWKKSIPAGPGQGTLPVRASWPAIVDAETLYDLERLVPGYLPCAEYGQMNKLDENEQGAYKHIRFFLTDQGKVWEDSGATAPSDVATTDDDTDVHCIVIFGEGSFGGVKLGGKDTPVEFIAHKPGSAGSADPLNQRGSAGWKAPQAGKIKDETQMLRLEIGVTA